jgi:hypothetical protein
VRVATTGDINLAAGGLLTIDGVTVAPGDRVLVKNQTDARQNGIYGTSAGEWYRASDGRSPRSINKGTTVHVQEGTANGGKVYAFQTLFPEIGADDIQISFYISDDIVADAENEIQDIADAAVDQITEIADDTITNITNITNEAIADIEEAGQEQLNDIEAAGEAITGIVSPIIIAENTFGTKGSVELWNPETPPDYVRTAGHYTAGDGGGALYRKVASEPAHAGKIQSADGTWWEIRESILTPEMFGGGVGRTGSENHQAIVDAIAAIGVNFTSNGGFAGPVIEFGYGTYQFSDTIHLRNVVTLRGKGGGGGGDQGNATILQFANDKHGIVVHHPDTFGLTGSCGTWAAGKTYIVGNMTTLNGGIRHVTGGNIYTLVTAGGGLTAAPAPSHTSGTVIGADGYAWRWEAPYSTAAASIIENMALFGGYDNGGVTTGHAIWGRARFDAKNLYIKYFAGDAYHIWAGAQVTGELRGNANNWRIWGGRAINCNHGLFVKGPDGNAGTCFGSDFSANRGWGIRDESFLGNVYDGVHTNGNAEGARRQYDRNHYVCIDQVLGPTTTPGTNVAVWHDYGEPGGGAAIVDWVSGTAYAVGAYVEGSNQRVYRVTTAVGNSTVEPIFSGSAAQTLADGYNWTPTDNEVWVSGDTTIVEGGSFNFPLAADSQRSLLLGCYAEVGQPCRLAANTMAIYPGFGFTNLTADSLGVLYSAGGFNKLRLSDNASDGTLLEIAHMVEDDVLESLKHATLSSSIRRRKLDFTGGGITTEYAGSAANRTQYDTLAGTTTTFGRTSPVPHAKYIDRLFLGLRSAPASLANGRQICFESALPTTGQWARGDVIFNHIPVAGGPMGWVCVTSGTAGSTAVFKAMGNLAA